MSAGAATGVGVRRHRPGTAAVPLVLAAATVGAQVAYTHVEGAARNRLTVAIVVVFFAASLSHAWLVRGPAFAARLVAVGCGVGLVAELVGVWTGVPFGAYSYAGTLGPAFAGVPLVIPLAWTMVGYPALAVARRVTDHPVAGPLFAAAALATWDLFLDPQMVAAGHWSWSGGGPSLLGIPLTNHAGWYVTAVVIMGLLWPGSARPSGDDRLLYGLYLWVYGSSVLAHAVFLDLAASAVVGGIGMGAVVAVFLRSLRR